MASLRGLATAVMHHVQCIIARHHPPSVRSVEGVPATQRNDRALTSLLGHDAVVSAAVSVVAPNADRWRTIALAMAPRGALRPRPVVGERVCERFGRRVTTVERAPFLRAPRSLLSRDSEVRRTHPLIVSAAAQHSGDAGVRMMRRDHSVELVWRTAPRRTARVDVDDSWAGIPGLSQRVSAPSSPARVTAFKGTAQRPRMAPTTINQRSGPLGPSSRGRHPSRRPPCANRARAARFGGLFAARQGDMVVEAGAPNAILLGAPTVMIG